MTAPTCFYVKEALLLGEGWSDLHVILIREQDGRYRTATGADLVKLHEAAPGFIAATQSEEETRR